MEKIFITGATGFLGGAIVMEALERGLADQLLLLVRGETPAHALERVRANLRGFGAGQDVLESIGTHNILCADLADLAACGSDPRLDGVTSVIHSAALATFSNNPALERINVDGTRALARVMHHRPALRHFFFVGTAMACGPEAAAGTEIGEHEQLPLDDIHLVPYTHSKALAEHVLRTEFPDLPVIMLRPSIIVGDSRRGCSASQSIFWVFLVAQMLGAFTVDLDARIDVVPVDWCARAILDLNGKRRLQHKVYHLSAGAMSSVSFREVDAALASARNTAPVAPSYWKVPLSELRSLLPKMRECIAGCNDRLLLRALKLYGGFAGLSYVFGNAHLLAEGVPRPPRFTDYIDRCFESAKEIPIADQMAWDFK
jgi:nucleoside-diphosphate-sugar epimerase